MTVQVKETWKNKTFFFSSFLFPWPLLSLARLSSQLLLVLLLLIPLVSILTKHQAFSALLSSL